MKRSRMSTFIYISLWIKLGFFGVMTTSVQQTAFRRLDGKTYNGKPDLSVVVKSAMQCCVECLKYDCNSANYEPTSGTCEVNIVGRLDFNGNGLVEKSGWRLYEREPCGLGVKTGKHCHHLIADIKTQADAQSYCEELNESLPEIQSLQEMLDLVDDIMALFPTTTHWLWIGLDKTTMTWTTGNNVTFTYWDTSNGQPNSPAENCANFLVNLPYGNYWHDVSCLTAIESVCERRYD